MKRNLFSAILALVFAFALVFGLQTFSNWQKGSIPEIPNFQPTKKAENSDLIRVDSPMFGAMVKNPLVITGEARGSWFFEASFPVQLLDASGKEIAVTSAQAQKNWMTTDFVPFSATLNFSVPEIPFGTLVLKKDNPSGLPEHDLELRMPIVFRE